MTTDTIAPAIIIAELPEVFDPRWSRLPGITVAGNRITIDAAQYFFRFDSASWLVCDWGRVRAELLPAEESTEMALEQTPGTATCRASPYVHATATDYLAALPRSSVDVLLSVFGAFSFTDQPGILLTWTAYALKPGGRLVVVLRTHETRDYVLVLRKGT